jgi:hypothetical protein
VQSEKHLLEEDTRVQNVSKTMQEPQQLSENVFQTFQHALKVVEALESDIEQTTKLHQTFIAYELLYSKILSYNLLSFLYIYIVI